MRLQFNKTYFLGAVALFIIEVLIAIYMHDRFIRPFGGDVLVVILLYCMLKSVFAVRVWPATMAVLLFAYTIEVLQYLHIVNVLGLQRSALARVVIGTSFEWTDILAYTLGAAIVIFLEDLKKHHEIFC